MRFPTSSQNSTTHVYACTSLLEESGAQSGALSDQCMQFAMNKLWFRLLLVPFPATYWVYPGTFDFPLFIGQEIRVRSMAYLQLRKLQAYPCVHHLLRQKLKHHLIKQLWLLPIAPMPTPLHRHPPRQWFLHAPISQLNNRQRPPAQQSNWGCQLCPARQAVLISRR